MTVLSQPSSRKSVRMIAPIPLNLGTNPINEIIQLVLFKGHSDKAIGGWPEEAMSITANQNVPVVLDASLSEK